MTGNIGQCHIQVGPGVRKCEGRSWNRSLSQTVQKLLSLRFSGRYLGFRWKETSDFPGMAPLKSPYPENGVGRHRIVVSSWSVGKLKEVHKLHPPPPLFALQKSGPLFAVNYQNVSLSRTVYCDRHENSHWLSIRIFNIEAPMMNYLSLVWTHISIVTCLYCRL